MSASGPEVSRFVAGYWRLQHWGLTDQNLLRFIESHLELGISTVDHAMVYRSEQPFGRALALKPGLREQLEIVTKCGIRPQGFGELGAKAVNHYDNSKTAILESVDASLRNLGTDYIDMLLIHRPDYLMQVDEITEAFDTLKRAGKVRWFGVSNFSTAQFDTLQQALVKAIPDGLVTNQIEFSPLQIDALDNGLFEQASRYQFAPMLWSCLAGGSIFNGDDAKSIRIQEALRIVGSELGIEDLELVVYAWILRLPCRALPLLGSSKIERYTLACQALSLNLDREQWYRIWEAIVGYPVP